MKYLIGLLFLLFMVPSIANSRLVRGSLVAVISPVKIKVQPDGSKKPETLSLIGVTEKGLTKAEKERAVKYLKDKLHLQPIVYQTTPEGTIVLLGGKEDMSVSLLEWGLVRVKPQSSSKYQESQTTGQIRKTGIWTKP